MASIAFFASERHCRARLEEIVFGESMVCGECAHPLARGKGYYWCRACRKKVRLKAGTWLRGSKLSCRTILTLVYAWQRNVHPGAVKVLVGLSYPTIARWYSRFRKHLPRDTDLLRGVVEVDEAFFGRQKYQNQKILMGAIERGSGKIRLGEIPDREQDSLEYSCGRV